MYNAELERPSSFSAWTQESSLLSEQIFLRRAKTETDSFQLPSESILGPGRTQEPRRTVRRGAVLCVESVENLKITKPRRRPKPERSIFGRKRPCPFPRSGTARKTIAAVPSDGFRRKFPRVDKVLERLSILTPPPPHRGNLGRHTSAPETRPLSRTLICFGRTRDLFANRKIGTSNGCRFEHAIEFGRVPRGFQT